MQAFSIEKSIIEGENQVQDLFEFVKNMSCSLEAYEGELQVLSFDGKGVPVIKKEAAKIKARLNKGI